MAEMNNSGVIILRDESGVTEEFPYRDQKQFCLLVFHDKSLPEVLGKMPLKVMRRPLREWAEDWVVQHATEADAILDTILNECSPRFTTEAVMRAVKDTRSGDKTLFASEYGKRRDGVVVFHVFSELLRALALRLKERMAKPEIRWEVESLPNNGGVYRILLQGGQDEKGVHHNQGE